MSDNKNNEGLLSKKNLTIGLGVIAAAVVGYVGYQAIFGGGKKPKTEKPEKPETKAAAEAEPEEEAAPKTKATPKTEEKPKAKPGMCVMF